MGSVPMAAGEAGRCVRGIDMNDTIKHALNLANDSFQAGHDAGYKLGYKTAMADCQKIIRETLTPIAHTDTDRLERICNVVLRLKPETKELHAALSHGTLSGLQRMAQAALDASRAERVAP
jgi:hypothetical protein